VKDTMDIITKTRHI